MNRTAAAAAVAVVAVLGFAPTASAAIVPGATFYATQPTCSTPAMIVVSNTRSSSALYGGVVTVGSVVTPFRLTVGVQRFTYPVTAPASYSVVVKRCGLGDATYLTGRSLPAVCP